MFTEEVSIDPAGAKQGFYLAVHPVDHKTETTPLMRDGTEMDFSALRDEARTAVDGSGKSYTEVGEELDVHRTAVSRALKEDGPKFQKLQRRIIRHLTPYRVERQVYFKARREG